MSSNTCSLINFSPPISPGKDQSNSSDNTVKYGDLITIKVGNKFLGPDTANQCYFDQASPASAAYQFTIYSQTNPGAVGQGVLYGDKVYLILFTSVSINSNITGCDASDNTPTDGTDSCGWWVLAAQNTSIISDGTKAEVINGNTSNFPSRSFPASSIYQTIQSATGTNTGTLYYGQNFYIMDNTEGKKLDIYTASVTGDYYWTDSGSLVSFLTPSGSTPSGKAPPPNVSNGGGGGGGGSSSGSNTSLYVALGVVAAIILILIIIMIASSKKKGTTSSTTDTPG